MLDAVGDPAGLLLHPADDLGEPLAVLGLVARRREGDGEEGGGQAGEVGAVGGREGGELGLVVAGMDRGQEQRAVVVAEVEVAGVGGGEELDRMAGGGEMGARAAGDPSRTDTTRR